MNKSLCALLVVALVATPALAQVRPVDCKPVFPLLDEVATAPVLQDVTVAQAGPTAAAKKGFFGLPFLPFLLAAGGAGAAAALSGGGGGNDSLVSPA